MMTTSNPGNIHCTCDCTSKGCTAGSVFAGLIVGILVTVILLRGQWGRIKLYILKRFRKPKAVSNAAYDAEFSFDPNAKQLKKEDSLYQNVVIDDEKAVTIAETTPTEEGPGEEEAVYSVSLKKAVKQPGLPSDMVQKIASLHGQSDKQPGLPSDMVQKIASLHGKSDKIVARESQEQEDYVDIEKDSHDHVTTSRSLTLPSKIRQHSSPAKAPRGEKKKSGSKKSEKKKTKHVSISDEPPEQHEETAELMPATSALVMKEVSPNGEYFVLDKTFC